MLATRFVPRPIARAIKKWYYFAKLRRAVRKIRSGDTSLATIRLLLEGWNNSGYAGRPEYLQRVAEAAKGNPRFLECGSGASTILLAAMGAEGISLEHHPDWLQYVRTSIQKLGLRADLRFAPLRNYGEFDWYGMPPLSGQFSLVVCDGPPGSTHGGRYGLFPIACHLFTNDCVILLDDLDRADEQAIVQRWCNEYGVSLESRACFGELRVKGALHATPKLQN
jgi:hypothetical protein